MMPDVEEKYQFRVPIVVLVPFTCRLRTRSWCRSTMISTSLSDSDRHETLSLRSRQIAR